MDSDYACPFCQCALGRCSIGYECTSCDRVFPVVDGIPSFATRDHYWNHLDPEQMGFFLDIARTHGYRYAVENILGRFRDRELVRYVLGANRADFHPLLPVQEHHRVLDLGSGWGAVACGLAKCCASITAADTNPYTLRFIDIRARQDGLGNVRCSRIDPLDDGRLPFASQSFDIAVMNGVLEYVGCADSGAAPDAVQERCLREVRRVLKRNGALYIGIENRYAYLYFLGTRDHNGLRYTSLMPRPLASAVTWLHQRAPYRTYTHSYRGYHGLLARSGFGRPRVFLAVPNYRDPRFIVPADDNRAIAYLVRRYAQHLRKRSWRWFARTLFGLAPPAVSGGLARCLSDSFMLVAEPSA